MSGSYVTLFLLLSRICVISLWVSVEKPKRQPGGVGLPFWLLQPAASWELTSRCAGRPLRLAKHRDYHDSFVSTLRQLALGGNAGEFAFDGSLLLRLR